MGSIFTFNVYQTVDNEAVLKEIKALTKTLNTMANSIKDLTAQIEATQAATDAKQEQIIAKVDVIQAQLAELITDGGTEEERQALADKIAALRADIESTDIDAPVEPAP